MADDREMITVESVHFHNWYFGPFRIDFPTLFKEIFNG